MAEQQQHPITPPPELMEQWYRDNPEDDEQCYIATQAARWGADQELEACCEWCADGSMVLALELRAALADEPPEPAPPADGEVADVVRWLRSRAGIPASPDFPAVASYLTRAADLLECLEQVAYAASDFICGTRFPEFANEHGGIDRLMADLCRLVAQFEHGPRPVPGVDVPGPDGDWGGLAELCNAEGVDLRIGVPLLQRAREAWKYASQAAPVPAEGEVAELVAWLQEEADDYDCIGCEDSAAQCNRAAELLQRLNPPQPVPVSERLPGPEDMTDDGEVWIEDPGHEYPLADAGDYDWDPHKWILRPIGKFDAQNGLRWLPAHALPLPEAGE